MAAETVQPVQVGDPVVFVNALGIEHRALATALWGTFEEGDPSHGTPIPSLNVVFVSNDPDKHDTYGRQIERATSVVHASLQAAHGMSWRNL